MATRGRIKNLSGDWLRANAQFKLETWRSDSKVSAFIECLMNTNSSGVIMIAPRNVGRTRTILAIMDTYRKQGYSIWRAPGQSTVLCGLKIRVGGETKNLVTKNWTGPSICTGRQNLDLPSPFTLPLTPPPPPSPP